jgi:WD40 repeat protein
VFSPDGRALASCSNDKTARLWDSETGHALHILEGHTSDVNAVLFSPDGRSLASCSIDATVRLWDRETGRTLHILEGHTGAVISIVFSPDGRTLASCSMDGTVRLWIEEGGGMCLEKVMSAVSGLTFVSDISLARAVLSPRTASYLR